jgi:hypothetical protein
LELEVRVVRIRAPLHTGDQRRDHDDGHQRKARSSHWFPSERNGPGGRLRDLPRRILARNHFWKCLALISM